MNSEGSTPFYQVLRKWWKENMRPPFDSYTHVPEFLRSIHDPEINFAIFTSTPRNEKSNTGSHTVHVRRDKTTGKVSVHRWTRDGT